MSKYFLLSLNFIVMLLPIVAYLLIILELHIYKFRLFITDYIFYLIVVLIVNTLILFFLDLQSNKREKVMMFIIMGFGIFFYLISFDLILPW